MTEPKRISPAEIELLKTMLRSHGLGLLTMKEDLQAWRRKLQEFGDFGCFFNPNAWIQHSGTTERWKDYVDAALRFIATTEKVLEKDLEFVRRATQ